MYSFLNVYFSLFQIPQVCIASTLYLLHPSTLNLKKMIKSSTYNSKVWKGTHQNMVGILHVSLALLLGQLPLQKIFVHFRGHSASSLIFARAKRKEFHLNTTFQKLNPNPRSNNLLEQSFFWKVVLRINLFILVLIPPIQSRKQRSVDKMIDMKIHKLMLLGKGHI